MQLVPSGIKTMKECGKGIKILSVRVYGENPVGQKERDSETTVIPLFCFCCHHRFLVMSVFGAWQFIIIFFNVCCQQLFQMRIIAQGALYKQQWDICNQAGINEVWGNFYCGEQNNAKPASCLDFWLPNKPFLCVACECWLMIFLHQTGSKGAH